MEIEKKINSQIIPQDLIDDLTRKVLQLPQADCPVAHYFGPGTYIRQITFPAGIFAIGHKQRFAQMNIFLAGRVAMIQPDGSRKEIKAPMIFMGPAGQKMGIILETVTWLNVYPNPDNERDIDILENRFMDKTGPWTEKEAAEKDQRFQQRHDCRKDYQNFLIELNIDEAQIRRESEYQGDLIDMPDAFSSVISVRDSEIEGKGCFASWPYLSGDIIGPARIDGYRTQLGRYTNHSGDPNAIPKQLDNGDIIFIATKDIAGCRGGDRGTEITIDYRESYKLRVTKCLE